MKGWFCLYCIRKHGDSKQSSKLKYLDLLFVPLHPVQNECNRFNKQLCRAACVKSLSGRMALNAVLTQSILPPKTKDNSITHELNIFVQWFNQLISYLIFNFIPKFI